MHASSSGNHALSSAYEPGYCKPRVGIRPSYDQVAVKWITHKKFAELAASKFLKYQKARTLPGGNEGNP